MLRKSGTNAALGQLYSKARKISGTSPQIFPWRDLARRIMPMPSFVGLEQRFGKIITALNTAVVGNEGYRR